MLQEPLTANSQLSVKYKFKVSTLAGSSQKLFLGRDIKGRHAEYKPLVSENIKQGLAIQKKNDYSVFLFWKTFWIRD